VRSIVSLVVAVAVTLHSLLGCCWHHAHCAEATVDEHRPAACPATHGCCGHDEADDHDREHADEPGASELSAMERSASECPASECPPTGCDETVASEPAGHEHPEPCSDSCSDKVFVVTTARVPIEHSPATVFAAIAATRFDVSAEIRATLAEYGSRDAATYPPPTRLHLLHRSLLI